MNASTLKAITAILETDPTIPDSERALILKVAKNPEVVEKPASQPKVRLLIANDVAEMLQVSTRTVWRLAAQQRLRPIRLGGRCTRFRMEDVLRLCSIDGEKKE